MTKRDALRAWAGLASTTLIFLFSGTCLTADPAIRRTTLLVSDATQSRAFYELAGFREWLDWSGDQDPNEPTALPLSGSPTESRIVIMAGKDNYNGMIGLLEFDGPPLSENRLHPEKLGLKDVILMIEVEDVGRVYDLMTAVGHTILRTPGAYVSNGPAGRKEGTNMLVRDPDGYVIELTDVTKRN